MFKKRRMFLCSCGIALVMLCSIILSCVPKVNNVPVRSIDVNELGNLSYEDKANQVLANFDSYSGNINDGNLELECEVVVSENEINQLQFLISNDEDNIIKKYKTSLDVENEKFIIITQYIQDEKIIKEEKLETIPVYDEKLDDYFITFPDGTCVSMAQTLADENMDNCLAATATAATAATVALLVTTIVVLAPVVVETVTTVFMQVVTWVRSFWSWFKSLFTKKTVMKAVTTTSIAITYRAMADNKIYNLKPFVKELVKEVSSYHLALGDTDDGLLYVCPLQINHAEALLVLTASKAENMIKSAHKGSNKSFKLSIYTSTAVMACAIALEAGTILLNPGAQLHIAKDPGYFDHYHPGGKYEKHSPHAFYGLPKV